jgi:hypothetical protein
MAVRAGHGQLMIMHASMHGMEQIDPATFADSFLGAQQRELQ